MSLMNGLILIDKPKGPTSNQISIYIKQQLNTKTAHVGTLDPKVTGVLPILLGKTIKLQEFLQKHDKEYVCLMETSKQIDKKTIEQTFKEFTGKIYQRPPELSAVAKNIRTRRLYSFELLQLKENLILFKTFCQHGTYIRKLIDDLALIWGTEAKMLELRRTNSGGFTEQECTKITELQDAIALKEKKPELLQNIIKTKEYAVKRMPSITVKKTAGENIIKGAPVYPIGIEELKGDIVHDKPVAIFQKDELIAIGISLYDKKNLKNNKKGIAIKTKKVLV